MLAKIVVISAAAAGLLMAQPHAANAGTNFEIGIGSGYPSYPNDPYPGYGNGDDQSDYITCREGRQIVRQAGFRFVRPIVCEGDVYRYRARRNGYEWRVSVDADTGDIIRARKIRPYSYPGYSGYSGNSGY